MLKKVIFSAIFSLFFVPLVHAEKAPKAHYKKVVHNSAAKKVQKAFIHHAYNAKKAHKGLTDHHPVTDKKHFEKAKKRQHDLEHLSEKRVQNIQVFKKHHPDVSGKDFQQLWKLYQKHPTLTKEQLREKWRIHKYKAVAQDNDGRDKADAEYRKHHDRLKAQRKERGYHKRAVDKRRQYRDQVKGSHYREFKGSHSSSGIRGLRGTTKGIHKVAHHKN